MLYREKTLDTPHGQLETPTLFPVRNIGKRSSDNTPSYTKSIPDISTAMVNSRAIRDRQPQWNRLIEGATLREELEVADNTIIFADSGGYDFRRDEIDTTPERTLETQRQLRADLFGTIDLPLTRRNSPAENQQRAQRSIELALAASEQHADDSLLIASVHGYDPKTVQNTISHLERFGEFDGFGLGSLVPIRTDYEKVTKLIISARRATDKHLHVYGLGGLVYQPLLLYLGVDSFDSSSFIRSAGKRRYLIPGFGGEELRNIDELEHLPCTCPVCCVRPLEQVRAERDLLVKHNLWALATELRRFRYMAAANEDLEHYLDLRFQGNEVTHRAYNLAKQQVRRLA